MFQLGDLPRYRILGTPLLVSLRFVHLVNRGAVTVDAHGSEVHARQSRPGLTRQSMFDAVVVPSVLVPRFQIDVINRRFPAWFHDPAGVFQIVARARSRMVGNWCWRRSGGLPGQSWSGHVGEPCLKFTPGDRGPA